MVGGLVVNVLSAPLMFSEYGSIGGSPTSLQDLLWFGVKNQTDEQVGGLLSALSVRNTQAVLLGRATAAAALLTNLCMPGCPQVLVLSQILASDATIGYERYSDIQVCCSACLAMPARAPVPPCWRRPLVCWEGKGLPSVPVRQEQPRTSPASPTLPLIAGAQCADPHVQRPASEQPAAAGTGGGDVRGALHGFWCGP